MLFIISPETPASFDMLNGSEYMKRQGMPFSGVSGAVDVLINDGTTGFL